MKIKFDYVNAPHRIMRWFMLLPCCLRYSSLPYNITHWYMQNKVLKNGIVLILQIDFHVSLVWRWRDDAAQDKQYVTVKGDDPGLPCYIVPFSKCRYSIFRLSTHNIYTYSRVWKYNWWNYCSSTSSFCHCGILFVAFPFCNSFAILILWRIIIEKTAYNCLCKYVIYPYVPTYLLIHPAFQYSSHTPNKSGALHWTCHVMPRVIISHI